MLYLLKLALLILKTANFLYVAYKYILVSSELHIRLCVCVLVSLCLCLCVCVCVSV